MLIRLEIQSIVHGGAGLARHEGRVVFVRGAAPGDLVEVELDDSAARPQRFEHATVQRLVSAGPARVEAPCPIVDRCGGCPLQHTSAPAQLAGKEALLRDALTRTGGLNDPELWPIVPSPQPLRYRRRARLHRGPRGQWGFKLDDRVEPVAECLLFEPALQALADGVRAELGSVPGVVDLGLDTSDKGQGAVDLRTASAPTPSLRKRARELLASVPGLRGVTLGTGEANTAPEIFGDPVLVDSPQPWRLRSRPDLFAQANRGAVPLLQAAVLEALGDAERVLELFCGAGTLTLPLLARGARVTGVEFAGPALALLRKSADELGAADRLRLIAGDAAKVAHEAFAGADAVLLDPPRTGAAALMPVLARLRPQRIVYVSCDAPTLGRDAKALIEAGYRLLRAVPFDLFPQTAHFEVVATFVRG